MIFDVITLAATGSEMNWGSVITNEETQQKYSIHNNHLFPKVSVINPKLQATVSRDYLVYSAADIIAHSIEAYFTAEYRPEIIDFLVESNIKPLSVRLKSCLMTHKISMRVVNLPGQLHLR